MPQDDLSDRNGVAPAAERKDASELPQISLPKGGGAIRGIGEKFAANPATGAGTSTVPIYLSPGRSGFTPQLGVAYNSGSGNAPMGFGWSLSVPIALQSQGYLYHSHSYPLVGWSEIGRTQIRGTGCKFPLS